MENPSIHQTAMILEPSFYVEKEAEILELARGLKVLHLGCVGHTDASTEGKIKYAKQTLHARLTEEAGHVIGIDLDTAAVEGLLEAGIFDNVRVGDACRLDPADLGTDWDLVVVGDLIEHVSNPGQLLDSIRGVMGSETLLVFTTPNAFGLPAGIRYLLGKFKEGKEHVMSFNYINLQQLLQRHGLVADKLGTCYQTRAKSSAGFSVGRAILGRAPSLGGTLFVVARRAE